MSQANLLHSIAAAGDLKVLDASQLVHVAQQMRSRLSAGESATANARQALGLLELSIALYRIFDIEHDHIIWAIDAERGEPAPSASLRFHGMHWQPAQDEQSAHEPARLAEAIGAASGLGKLRHDKWVVYISAYDELPGDDVIDSLRALQTHTARFLWIVCQEQSAAAIAKSTLYPSRRAWARLARSAHLQASGPILGNDLETLIATMDGLKQSQHPAILHLDIRQLQRAEQPAAESLSTAESKLTELPVDSYFAIAADHLARLARHDARVVAVSMTADESYLGAWTSLDDRVYKAGSPAPHVLSWCAGLATTGCRPFVFITGQTLRQLLPEILAQIDAVRADVTLLIDGSGEDESSGETHDLGLLRLLAKTAVLSPAGPAELMRMLDWTLSQSGPQAIWLPQAAPADDPLATELDSIAPCEMILGQGEQLAKGDDVALIAWGPLAEAAKAASDILAGEKIAAAVVSARFAQPLDTELILRAARGALCTVILDRPSSGGGFSAAVLELLAQHGLPTPISVLTPSLPWRRNNPHNRQSRRLHAIEKIVERCRWLSEPADELSTDATALTSLPAVDADRSRWINLLTPVPPRRYDEHQQVLAAQLNPTVEGWMQTYLKAGRRKLYFWKWCVHGAELTTLPCVAPQLRASVRDTKVLSIMLCVLLDDVADQQDKAQLLEVLLAIIDRRAPVCIDQLSEEDRNCALVTEELTRIYFQRIEQYPRYRELADLLHYDQLQYFNTMRYSHLLNHHLTLLNVTEHDLYMPHAMHMMSFATLDLMCTPEFDMNELGRLREAIWHAQCMGRIGNLLSTWRREIGEHDFNSGVFARAMTAGDLTPEELADGDADTIESAIVDGGHEQHFLAQWRQHRQSLEQHLGQIHSVDLEAALEGQERFFQMHFDSRGLI